VIYDDGAPGSATISLDAAAGQGPVTGLDFLFADYLPGAYSTTATAYDGSNVVDSQTVNGVAGAQMGQFASFNLTGLAITSVVVSSTNDGHGWAIGGTSAPEPATWTMLLVGFAGLGAALREGRRRLA
jgi:hypothetical protein